MPRMGLTPEKVVCAAARLADQAGLDELSLSALAADLGVRVPSLYKHVGGLADLQQRLAAHGSQELSAAVESAADGRAGRSALAAVADAFRAFAHRNPGCYQAASRLAEDGRRTRRTSRVDTVLRRVVAGYGLGPDEARTAAHSVHSALHGFVLLEASGAIGLDADASFRAMLDLLDRGLASGAAARPRFRLSGLALPGRGDAAPRPR